MKYIFTILFLISELCSTAQSKKVREVLYNTNILERTVFDTKDSATLEKLFASTLSYEHSSGKVETREQAISGIIHNRSVYIQPLTMPTATNVQEKGDSIITTKVFQATERKPDGTESLLDLTIELVWIKEKGNWKLVRRKATKNQ